MSSSPEPFIPQSRMILRNWGVQLKCSNVAGTSFGWFDAVLVRQTCATSGVNGIALTKLDVLDGFEELKICTGYEIDGVTYDYLPTAAEAQARCTPVYETMPGWADSTAGARSWADLPGEAIKYVRRIEELIQCPVALLSTSPEREDTILVTDPFAD